MRIYQSSDGEWIATDDKGIKVRGATAEEATAAYRVLVPDEPKEERPPPRPERRMR